MLQIIVSVLSLQNGSMKAVSATGRTSMSDSLMADPAADAGAVEAQALLEGLFVEFLGGDGEVLPQAGKVHEAQIDGADFLFPDQGQDFFRCHGCKTSRGRTALPVIAMRDAVGNGRTDPPGA